MVDIVNFRAIAIDLHRSLDNGTQSKWSNNL